MHTQKLMVENLGETQNLIVQREMYHLHPVTVRRQFSVFIAKGLDISNQIVPKIHLNLKVTSELGSILMILLQGNY